MKRIFLEMGKYTDHHNNAVRIWHEIEFEGSLLSIKELYGAKTTFKEDSSPSGE